MSFLSTLGGLFLDGIGPVDVQARHGIDEFPSFEEQMAVIQNRGRYTYRTATVDEALGVPAIFSAVTLIAGTMGTLTMDGYKNEGIVPAAERPPIMVRPNPFTKPYWFWFLSAYYKATRGERWWWVAARDANRRPLSLFPVAPWEIVVEANDRDRLRPTIKWGDRIVPNEDMIADFWFPDSTGLRGVGPLQKAGAAVSVAVEAQQWAANFFSGSIPSIIGSTEESMTAEEMALMDEQWLEKAPNLPRWVTNGLKMSESPFNPEKAQLTDTRQYNVADVARMFSMPGSLIENQMSGSSLTYRNESGIWADFQRRCLMPIFSEPMEQDMSDLLPRGWTAQFNFDRMLRADQQTRYETYQTGIDAGIITAEEARKREGLDPGAAEFAQVPFAAPQAIPSSLPPDRVLGRTALTDLRCPACSKLLGRVSGAAEVQCPRCRRVVAAA
jgi:HK97 family phage portal protein